MPQISENMLDVLMYLFENHMQNSCDIALSDDTLTSELEQAGFEQSNITLALQWIKDLHDQQHSSKSINTPSQQGFRIFNPIEMVKMDGICRGFIYFLELVGILNARTREIVIDRIMELDADYVALYQVKWVTLMVLFNEKGEKKALASMEHLILADTIGGTH